MIPGIRVPSLDASNRTLYKQLVESKLAEKKALLVRVKRRAECSGDSGRTVVKERQQNAGRRADACLIDLERFLSELDSVDDDAWEAARLGIEVALEDFSQSIQRFVAQLP